jgi:Brp/Blh family beta-carotene 15,15'-monooxygenase
MFVFVPDIALLLFVIISAYHFGEQHWHDVLVYSQRYIKLFYELVYGCFIFSLIFYFHLTEVESIIESICGYYINLSMMWLYLTVSGVLLVLVGIYFYRTNKFFKMQITEQILYLLVLAIIFRVSGLIWSFAIYFVLWHSLPSLHDQIKFLYGSVDRNTIFDYIKKAFVYWLASIVGLVVLYFVFKDYKVFEALLFSFIAAITFPHVVVIYKMFSSKK